MGHLMLISSPDPRHALTLLTRLAARRPSQRAALAWAVARNLDGLAEPALEIAIETGDPLGACWLT